jgi:ankyrin repeat protein
MRRTKIKRKDNKPKTQKQGVGGNFDNRYFKKLNNKSQVVKNIIENIDDQTDFLGFILDLQAKYYKDLSQRQKKEVFELLIEYLETNKIKYNKKPKISTNVLIGITSVARLLEMKNLFKNLTLFFSSQIVGQKLLSKTKEILYKFTDLVHPDDQIVMETFEKNSYVNIQIFDKFIKWSIENVENLDVLKILFDMGFSIIDSSKIDNSGELLSAIKSDSLELFKILVENGQRDVYQIIRDKSYLNYAAHFGNLEIVKYLVEKYKLDVNYINTITDDNKEVPSHGNPLYNAVEQNHIDIAKYLIEKGSDVDEYGGRENEENYTPIFEAIINRNFDMVKLLVKNGAYLKHRTYTGRGLDIIIDEQRDILEDELYDKEINEREKEEIEKIYEYIENKL